MQQAPSLKMPYTAVHNTLRGPPCCRLFQCIALFAAYLTFLSYLIRWVTSDQTCKNDIITLSGWNCLFWNHGVNLLYFLFFAIITLAAHGAILEAEATRGIDNYEILFHSINNIPIMPWTVVTWHRIGKLASWLLGFDNGAERPPWVESLLKIIESSIITAVIYGVIAVLLFLVLSVLAVVCFVVPIRMLLQIYQATLKPQPVPSTRSHVEAMALDLCRTDEHCSARGNAVVLEPVKGCGEHCSDEGPGDRSYRAVYDLEEAREPMFSSNRMISTNGRDSIESGSSLSSS